MARLHSKAAGRNWQPDTHSLVSNSNLWQKLKISRWGSGLLLCADAAVYLCVFIWLLLWDSTVHIHIVASVCFICAHVSNTLHFASFIVQNHHCVHKCKSGSYTHTAHGLFWKTCSCGSEHHASSPITHNQVCHTRVKYIKILRNSREKTKDKKLPEPSEADGLSQYQRTAVSVFPFLCLHLIQEGKSQGKKVCVSTQTQETRLPIP